MGHSHIERNNYFLHQNLGEIGNGQKKKYMAGRELRTRIDGAIFEISPHI